MALKAVNERREEEEDLHSSEGMKSRRILSLILAVLVLAILMFSALYIAVESDHDCAGHDCPVCLCIRQCEAIISMFSIGQVKTVRALLSVIFFIAILHFTLSFCVKATPVSRKVRLNN